MRHISVHLSPVHRLALTLGAALGLACGVGDLVRAPDDAGTNPLGNPDPSAARLLTFTTQPSAPPAGGAITPAITVAALDSSGAPAVAFTGTISMALGVNPAGADLAGTLTRTAVDGIATFDDLAISRAGTRYTLVARASGLTQASSTEFDVTPAPGEVAQPESGDGQEGVVGTALASPYVIKVVDGAGNPVAGRAVQWAVTAGGGDISPASGITSDVGTAQAIHTLGNTVAPQRVTAAVAEVADPVTFTAIAQPGPATIAVVVQQPSSAEAETAIAPPILVELQDQYGNAASTTDGAITMSIVPLTGTPLATLSGTRTRTLAGGRASFDDLSINLSGAGYRLRAAVGGLSVDTDPFDVTPSSGTATGLGVVSGNNQSAAVASPLPAPYVVRVTNDDGDPVPNTPVIWTTADGGSVSPATTLSDASGHAGATHTLGPSAGPQVVTAAIASGAASTTFTATAVPGPVANLVVSQQPAGTVAGTTITPPVRATLHDAYGNTATGATTAVTMALVPQTGAPDAALSGTLAVAPVAGTATFDDLSVDRAGVAYRLRVTSGPLSADSDPFDVTPAAAAAVTRAAGDGQQGMVGTTLPTPLAVRVTDALGNPVQDVAVAWSALDGASVAPTTTATDASGQAAAVLTLGTTAGIQRAIASVAGVPDAASFTATAFPGSPERLTFRQDPTSVAMGAPITPPVVVVLEDAYGNLTGTGSVTVGIVPLSGTPGATLSGTTVRAITNGVATFNDLRVNLVGVGYRLRASAGPLSADSDPFNVTL